MSEALIISNALLWLAVIGLCGAVLVLVRQIGVLHERVAPAGALIARAEPRIGEPAPRVDVVSGAGEVVRLDGHDDGRATLIFFFSPTCPVCAELFPVLRSVASAERRWLRVVLASDAQTAGLEKRVREQGIAPQGYVASRELLRVYQVGALPFAVLIDARGIVRAQGLVNSREHLESLFEAMERGVASMQEYLQGNEDAAWVA